MKPTHDMGVQVPGNGFVNKLGEFGSQWRGDLWSCICSDAGLSEDLNSIIRYPQDNPVTTDLVIHHLLSMIILLKQREELNNIGILERSVQQWKLSE